MEVVRHCKSTQCLKDRSHCLECVHGFLEVGGVSVWELRKAEGVVPFSVEGQLAGLAKLLPTVRIRTRVGLGARMDVGMLSKVLSQSKALVAVRANVIPRIQMGQVMASKTELGFVDSLAARILTCEASVFCTVPVLCHCKCFRPVLELM